MGAASTRSRGKARRSKHLSMRAFAKQIGVTGQALSKGFRAGRLVKSIGRTAKGRPYISDPALALEEWRAGATKSRPTNGNGHDPAKAAADSLTEAQIRVNFQREVKLELENMQKRGLLIDAAKERHRDFECARTVRDSILNIPDRVAAELAAETAAGRVHARLDEELRAALDALADALDDPSTDSGGGDAGE